MRQLNRIDAIRLKCFFPFSFNSAEKTEKFEDNMQKTEGKTAHVVLLIQRQILCKHMLLMHFYNSSNHFAIPKQRFEYNYSIKYKRSHEISFDVAQKWKFVSEYGGWWYAKAYFIIFNQFLTFGVRLHSALFIAFHCKVMH